MRNSKHAAFSEKARAFQWRAEIYEQGKIHAPKTEIKEMKIRLFASEYVVN